MDNNVVPNQVPDLLLEVKKFNPIFIGLLVLLVICASIATGYYLGKKQANVQLINQLTPTPVVSPTLTQIPTQTLKIDETATWKTYTNSANTYTFEYPDTWYVGAFRDGSIGLHNTQFDPKTIYEPDQIAITMDVVSDRALLESYAKNFKQTSLKQTFDGIEFKISDLRNEINLDRPPIQIVLAQTEKRGVLYRFGLSTKDYVATLDQILSTFKFTN